MRETCFWNTLWNFQISYSSGLDTIIFLKVFCNEISWLKMHLFSFLKQNRKKNHNLGESRFLKPGKRASPGGLCPSKHHPDTIVVLAGPQTLACLTPVPFSTTGRSEQVRPRQTLHLGIQGVSMWDRRALPQWPRFKISGLRCGCQLKDSLPPASWNGWIWKPQSLWLTQCLPICPSWRNLGRKRQWVTVTLCTCSHQPHSQATPSTTSYQGCHKWPHKWWIQ